MRVDAWLYPVRGVASKPNIPKQDCRYEKDSQYLLHVFIATDLNYYSVLNLSNLNEDLELKNEDFWWPFSYNWCFILSSGKLCVKHTASYVTAAKFAVIVDQIQNSKHTSIQHSGNQSKEVAKIIFPNTGSVWMKGYKRKLPTVKRTQSIKSIKRYRKWYVEVNLFLFRPCDEWRLTALRSTFLLD